MKPKQRRNSGRDSGFMARLARNPSGVPRLLAVRLALIGVGLGITTALIAHTLTDRQPATSLDRLILAALPASLSGAILGPLGLLLLARALDRTVRAEDHLVGYSGIIRMLLHAGELSFLGALGGGISGGSAGVTTGLLAAMLVCSLVAAVLYRLRGLGSGLGLTVGVLMGAISGLIGGVIGQLGS